MKRLFFLFLILNFFSCGKDELMTSPSQDQNAEKSEITTRQIADLPDSLWQLPTDEQLDGVWKDMMIKADVNQIGSFLYEYGLFDWSRSRLVKEYDNDFVLSIPTIENDSISSILFVGKVGIQYTYWHLALEDLMIPTSELIQQYGTKNTLLAILEFIKHEQFYGNYAHTFLFHHYYNSDLQDEITEIHPRGWCLVEILLYNPPAYDENELHYSEATNWTFIIDGGNFIPLWEGKADISGQDIGGGYTLIRLWAWCPDEIGQDPYSNNWTTNIDGTGGNGNTDDDPDWDYDYPRWTEYTKKCMFAFNDGKATEKINQLEEELLKASCGDASEYIIKSIIDNIILDLCEEYYENQEGSESDPQFPAGDGHNMNETLNTISSSIESHTIYQLGIEVCEVCKEVSPPSSCYYKINNCPPENYEECVNDVLCDYAISDFAETYGLTLGQDEIDAIKANVSTCGGEGFEKDTWKVIIDSKTNNNQNESDLAFLTAYLMSSNNKMDLLKYYEVIAQIRIGDPLVRWDRATQLIDVLKGNPNALTECNDPPNDISDWSTLASFVPPQAVLDKLEDLGEGWRLQGFQTPTAAPSINLDYFSTTITEMPKNLNTGEKYTPSEFFNYMRVNINDFVDKEASEFIQEEGLWDSNNPVGVVLSIDIQGPDNGSVICSQYEECCWIFSTVKAPMFPGYDGYHPVSGNRQFGYKITAQGHMEIYTKGVDRFLSPTSGPFSSSYLAEKAAGYLLEKVAFAGADGLWTSFQNGIKTYVSNPLNEGAAIVNTPVKNRPKVGEALKNLLKQDQPINFVPCGN